MPPANAPPPSLVRWGARKVHWRLTILLLSGLPNWNAKRNRRARSTWPFLIDTSKHERSGDWNAAIPMSLDARGCQACRHRSEEHTSELQSLMRISYAVFCLKKKNKTFQNSKHILTP